MPLSTKPFGCAPVWFHYCSFKTFKVFEGDNTFYNGDMDGTRSWRAAKHVALDVQPQWIQGLLPFENDRQTQEKEWWHNSEDLCQAANLATSTTPTGSLGGHREMSSLQDTCGVEGPKAGVWKLAFFFPGWRQMSCTSYLKKKTNELLDYFHNATELQIKDSHNSQPTHIWHETLNGKNMVI